jgi:hypothetical protein
MIRDTGPLTGPAFLSIVLLTFPACILIITGQEIVTKFPDEDETVMGQRYIPCPLIQQVVYHRRFLLE